MLLAAGLLAASLGPLAAAEREVAIDHGGLALLGRLVESAEREPGRPLVLMTHGTLAHKDMELMQALQAALAERGVSSLAHTLSLGVDRRTGMLPCDIVHRHRHEDALDEIAAWAAWLKSEGASRLVLLGHSRGGAQVARLLVERGALGSAAAVLVAPATDDPAKAAAAYADRYKAPLAPMLAEAKALAAAGRGGETRRVPGFVYCPDVEASAEAVLSYHGADGGRDTPTLLAGGAPVPVLVVAAGRDAVIPDLLARIRPVAEAGKVRLAVVDEADHMFLDLFVEDAADAIAAFLEGL